MTRNTRYSTFSLPEEEKPRRPFSQISTFRAFIFSIFLLSLYFFLYFQNSNATLPWEQDSVLASAQTPPLKTKEIERDIIWTEDVVGFTFCAIFVAIAAGGGIGGGGVLVPTYIFVLRFSPKYAIPLSNITILGASIANMACNFRKRHPLVNRPLIDWDIILMMEPLTIIGAIIGTFINILSPPWLISIMLVILLGGTAIRTFRKGIKKYKQESAERAEEKASLKALSEIKISPSRYQSQRLLVAEQSGNTTVASILKSEEKHSPVKVGIIFLVTGGVLCFSLLTGDGNKINLLGIQCGEPAYWCLTLAAIPYILLITYFSRKHLVYIYHLKKQHGYQYPPGDVMWNERNTIVYPLICSLAGLAAGMFGIGGGIVKGPLMLEMGTLPEVTSATSATMILFTSISASISYFIFGKLNLNYAVVLFCLGLVFTFVGQLGLDYIVKKYKRNSLIILIIGFVVALSAVAMGAQSFPSIIALFEGRAEPGGQICPRHGPPTGNPINAGQDDGETINQFVEKTAFTLLNPLLSPLVGPIH